MSQDDPRDVLDDFPVKGESESDSRDVPDATGLSDVIPILMAAHQIKAAAMISGFPETEAFTFARDYFNTIMASSIRANL